MLDFFKQATITTTLTKKGDKFIDEDNPLYPLRFLKHKPIDTLKGIQFIVLANGEADKLIEMTIGLPKTKSYNISDKNNEGEELDQIEESLIQLYQRDLNDEMTQEWNHHRKLLVKGRVENFIRIFLKNLSYGQKFLFYGRKFLFLADFKPKCRP